MKSCWDIGLNEWKTHFIGNEDAVHIIIIMTGCAMCLRNNK